MNSGMDENEQQNSNGEARQKALKHTEKALRICDDNGWDVAGINLSAAKEALLSEGSEPV